MQEIGESGGQAHLEKLDAIRSLPRSLNHNYYWSHTRMKWYTHITEVIYTLHVIEWQVKVSDFSRAGTMYSFRWSYWYRNCILCYCVPNIEPESCTDIKWSSVQSAENFHNFQLLASALLVCCLCFPSCDSTFRMCWHPYAYMPLAVAQGFPWQPMKLVLVHHWNMVMLTKVFIVHLILENCANIWWFNIDQFLCSRVWHQYLHNCQAL